MSFTAEVKEELARIEVAKPCCARAELSALMRVEGSLHFTGGASMRVEIVTETAPVARKIIKLLRRTFDLDTELTVRRSVLHRSNNYLITVVSQPRLDEALVALGIIDESFAPIYSVPAWLVEKNCCAVAYLRGTFLGGGFVADPRGDFHFELKAASDAVAQDLVSLMGRFGMDGRIAKRRGTHTVYLKGAEPIVDFLALVGAHSALLRTEDVRILKEMRNDVNRLVNAETANLQKTAVAAAEQVAAVRVIQRSRGLDALSPALREIALLRLEHPEASLRELGELADPPLSKSAVYHRIRRLQELAEGL